MIHYMTNVQFSKRFLFALLFASIFSVIGWFVPRIYFEHFDNTQYLRVSQPISVDKKLYQPCENTILTTHLTALIDVNVRSLTHLILTNERGDLHRIGDVIEANSPIKASDSHVVSGALRLPCDLETGTYFWLGNAEYEANGVKKVLNFVSETFTVNAELEKEDSSVDDFTDCSPFVGCI